MKADGTACYRCDNITNALKCTEFVINKADAGCGCSKCVAGYYVNSVDAENYCVNTNATEKNCY